MNSPNLPAPRPPRALRAAISLVIPSEDVDALIEDLDALYTARVDVRGRVAADLWYARQAVGFVTRLGVARMVAAVGSSGSLRADVVAAGRSLRKRPAFSLTFILTLAIGTGVLTTVYAAAQWVLLRPVPGVSGEDELVTLRLGAAGAPAFVSFDVSQPDLVTLRERLPVGGALAATTSVEVDLRPDGGEPRRIVGEMVSTNYFAVLRAPLEHGTTFTTAGDDPASGFRAAILSDRLATSMWPDDPTRGVGRAIRVNGATLRVIGVAVAGFRGAELPGASDIWLPLSTLGTIDPSVRPSGATSRGYGVWRLMIARAPGPGAAARVQHSANDVMAAVRREFKPPHSYMGPPFQFQAFTGIGLNPAVKESASRTLALLGLAAGLLFCLAIANLLNLALVQSTVRQSMLAIRISLGATSARLVRAMFAETLVLSLVGAAGALVFAAGWSRWFQDMQLDEHGAALTGLHVDLRTVSLTIVAAVIATTIAMIAPVRLLRGNTLDQLMRRATNGSPETHRLRSALVAVQVALSVILLITAALLVRTVTNLRRIDLGFQPDRLVTFSLDPHLHAIGSAAVDRLTRDLERRLVTTRTGSGAGFISPSPLQSGYTTAALYGSADPAAGPVVGAGYYVSPGFLNAIGAHVIAGETHWNADSGTMVIGKRTLEKLFPGVSPAAAIGRSVLTSRRRGTFARIVAVIADMKLSDITGDPPMIILRPMAERVADLSLTGFVTSNQPLGVIAGPVRRIVVGAAPELPVFDIRSARQTIDLQFAERNAMTRTALTLAVIGLALAAIGLSSVISNVVISRRREIAIRSALGAAPLRVLSTIASGGVFPICAGIIVGVALSAAGSKALQAQLYGMDRFDIRSYGAAVGALALAAFAACLIPGYRATRVSAAEVLRGD